MKNRKLNRLLNYNYSQQGIYFVTICAKNREHLFGEVKNCQMCLNDVGKIAEQYWLQIPDHFPHIKLDKFIVMPNHIHGIFDIQNVGNNNYCSLPSAGMPWQSKWSKSISSAIRGYKIGVVKWCQQNNWKNFAWQKSFYDRIIRNEQELNKIREYIFKNPANWEYDRNISGNIFM